MLQSFYIPPVLTHTREDGTKNVFTCLEKLGQGGFAVVYKVKHQNTNKIYAMKIVSKQFLMNAKGKSSLEKLKNEIQIQKSLVHSNIVQSKISFSDDFNYYIALEYCPGKNISQYLRNTSQGRLSEPETRKILKDVLYGLIYIHNRKIIHNDLKLENFIIGSDGKVKIADFGLSTFKNTEDKKSSTICGTPNYMSPEILMKKDNGKSFAADIWAIGVATYIMLTGKPPFAGTFKDANYDNIKNCQFSFPTNIKLSTEAKDFIKSILKLDPTKRPSAFDLLKHPFMTKHDSEVIQLYQKVQSPTKFGQISTQLYSPSKFYGNVESPNINSPIAYSPLPPPITNDNNSPFKRLILDSPTSNNDNNNNYYYENKETNNFVPNSFLLETNNLSPNRLPLQPNNFAQNRINIGTNHTKQKKNFTIPGNFVVKHSFLRDDLIYLLGNGTVGICFGDKSRIILDPNEQFAQYYSSNISPLEVIDLTKVQEINQVIDEKISLLKKFARAFKKFKNLYEPPKKGTFALIPLYHISSFIKKDSSVLYKFTNKNVQVDFGDGKKLILFWNSKKMCVTKNIKEKCILFGQNDISKMNADSDELKKFRKTKELLNELARSR